MEFLGKWSVMLFAVGLAAVMAVQDDLRGARVVAFLVLTVMLIVFVVFFAFGSPWYRTTEGRALLAYMFSLMIVCLQATFSIVFGPYPGRDLISALLLYAAAVTATSMFYLLMRNQRATRKEIARLKMQRDRMRRERDEAEAERDK